ncbi:MAG: PfkB family carbohydrate kinase, partial [Actinomycetota bacterium]
MRTAVIGHVEWVEFARVGSLPSAGSIIHASRWWEAPAGGGPGAAAQLLKLAGHCALYTALGDDEIGHRAKSELEKMGLDVHVAWRSDRSRRAFTHITQDGERTLTVLGDRLAPWGSDDLPWSDLENSDAVFFTAGDAAALKKGRAAKNLTATSRVLDLLRSASVRLDGLVGSADDPSESYSPG